MATEYMCSYCGKRETKLPQFGRPEPGTCSKRGQKANGMSLPHRWIVNRQRYAN